MWSHVTLNLVDLALSEDVGAGDLTTRALIDPAVQAKARIIAKESLIVCGLSVARLVFSRVNVHLNFKSLAEEGARVEAGTAVAEVSGSFAAILEGERTALNFLQRLSGIAGKTAATVKKIRGTGATILDTRKTTPGWRELEKYAVRTGGGANHRLGLFDQVLIKNNHIDALKGDVARAVLAARAKHPPPIRIEVEVRNRAELEQAAVAKPDIILFDNYSPEDLASDIIWLRSLESGKEILTEASGGIREENVLDYAKSGVNFLSLGALTHSARAADLALRFVDES